MPPARGPEAYAAHPTARPGQAELTAEAFASLRDGGFHLAAAPTGIGKTAAAIAAALAAAEAHDEPRTVMFLTGRQGQHRIAVETVRQINERRAGQRPVRLVDLIGQQGMCVRDDLKGQHPALFSRLCADERRQRRCHPYLEEAPELVQRSLRMAMHVEELVGHAASLGKPTCAWRVAREAAKDADIVVCDYNHVFSEAVRTASLPSMGLELDQLILVVDEAHNLPNRIRMGMRRQLTGDLLRDAADECEEHLGTLRQWLKAHPAGAVVDPARERKEALADELAWVQDAVQRWRSRFISWRNDLVRDINSGRNTEVRGEPKRTRELGIPTTLIAGQIEGILGETLGDPHDLPAMANVLAQVQVETDPGADTTEDETAAARVGHLLDLVHRFRDSPALACVFTLSADDDARITTHLLDPGEVAGPLWRRVAGALLMSGTLHPPAMYRDTLRLPRARGVSLGSYDSPFLSNRRPVALATNVTTLYKERGQQNTDRIRQHLEALVEAAPGHVAVFCPSYRMQEELIEEHRWRGITLLAERTDWSKGEVDAILGRLVAARTRGERILLAGVFGGKLAEGIDYHDNLLDGVACIGIPNAPPSVENDALREYLKSKFGNDLSWRYGVLQPAVNSVLQGMGRAIRSADDRAFVLLLDKRINQPQYRACLPEHMRPLQVTDAATTGRLAKRFFRSTPLASERAPSGG